MKSDNHYPFAGVIDHAVITISDDAEQWPLTVLLYQSSASSDEAGITNGIALIKDNSVVIDNIAEEMPSAALPSTEQKRLFYLATQLNTLQQLHTFIYDYGTTPRYRGTLD